MCAKWDPIDVSVYVCNVRQVRAATDIEPHRASRCGLEVADHEEKREKKEATVAGEGSGARHLRLFPLALHPRQRREFV